jgi:hypothetical protein
MDKKQQLEGRIKMIKKENKIESDRIKRLAKFHGERERGDVARNSQTSYRFSALGIKPLLRR